MPGLRRGMPDPRVTELLVTELPALGNSLEPLRDWFNRESGHVRIIAIQSAT
jgi:hypothetical protein